MKVLIACSSSMGHINPALTFGSYLKSKGVEVTYIGFKKQIEEKLLINEKCIFLDSKNSFKKSLNPISIYHYFKEVLKYRNKETFDAYIGFGGFINLSLLFLKGKKPLFIHEQNTILGDTNKLLIKFSKKIFSSFPLNVKNEVIVGNPSGENIQIKPFKYKSKLNILFTLAIFSLAKETL